MENFVYEYPTKVYFGKGAAKAHLPGILSACGPNVLLAYGGGSIKKNGVYEELMELLKAAGKTVTEFAGIMSNPTWAKVQEGAKLARDCKADLVLAVGGGSVIDCCKIVCAQAVTDEDLWDLEMVRHKALAGVPIPLGAVVTASGTGAEMNGGAVITNEAKKIKTGRDYPALNARFALMDPTYTFSVPKKQMISGSFDILSHIMETYFSAPNEDNVSDDIMEALMRSVIRNLRAAIQNLEDYTARSNLMWDSTMAENRVIKMGKKCDFECHNMEHQLGAYTNCNHGCGLAVIHPVYYRHVYKEGLPKFVRFAENVWSIARNGKTDEELALAGIEALADFIKEIGLPTTLKELGVDKTQLKEIADSCGISQGSYKPMTHEEILVIFQECYE